MRMKVFNVILQSADKQAGGTNVNFTVNLQEPITNVVAIRPLDITIQSDAPVSNLLIALNNYSKYLPVNDNNVRIFARASTGTTVFPAVAASIMDDPYTYILNPIEPRLQRFEVALYGSDYVKYTTTSTTISMTLAIYTL